jgi:transposase
MPRGHKTTITLVLTPEETQQLLSLTRRTKAPAGLVARAKAILRIAHGETVSATADTLGKSRRFVYKWCERYQATRLAGLHHQHGPRTMHEK